MKRIESFCVNHDKLTPGMYLSRIDGDAVTYDVRMVTPNAGVYLENDGIHTFEHLFATYVRNTADSDNILYVGPMGCQRQNSTPITLPKHWLAGRRKRWSISFKFFSC